MSSPEMMLYGYFLSNRDTPISYQRIKSFIGIIQVLRRKEINVVGVLAKLLTSGIVVSTYEGNYQLSPSCVIKGKQFSLGINLPESISDALITELTEQNETGLLIFPNSISLDGIDITISSIDLRKIFTRYETLRKIANAMLIEEEDEEISHMIERYDPNKNLFFSVNKFATGANLYRIYQFSKHHFYYLFEKRRDSRSIVQRAIIQRSDMERLAVIITTLRLECTKDVNYLIKKEMLVINPYLRFPETIEKLLYLSHVLERGEFPKNRSYSLSRPCFNELQRILDYKINTQHEQYI